MTDNPDRFCRTTADGSCVSRDPRCMHHTRTLWNRTQCALIWLLLLPWQTLVGLTGLLLALVMFVSSFLFVWSAKAIERIDGKRPKVDPKVKKAAGIQMVSLTNGDVSDGLNLATHGVATGYTEDGRALLLICKEIMLKAEGILIDKANVDTLAALPESWTTIYHSKGLRVRVPILEVPGSHHDLKSARDIPLPSGFVLVGCTFHSLEFDGEDVSAVVYNIGERVPKAAPHDDAIVPFSTP